MNTVLTLVAIETRLAGAGVALEVEGGGASASVGAGFVETRVRAPASDQRQCFLEKSVGFGDLNCDGCVTEVALDQVAADTESRRRDLATEK